MFLDTINSRNSFIFSWLSLFFDFFVSYFRLHCRHCPRISNPLSAPLHAMFFLARNQSGKFRADNRMGLSWVANQNTGFILPTGAVSYIIKSLLVFRGSKFIALFFLLDFLSTNGGSTCCCSCVWMLQTTRKKRHRTLMKWYFFASAVSF